eukprot:174845-Rhodomonas_salina.1
MGLLYGAMGLLYDAICLLYGAVVYGAMDLMQGATNLLLYAAIRCALLPWRMMLCEMRVLRQASVRGTDTAASHNNTLTHGT